MKQNKLSRYAVIGALSALVILVALPTHAEDPVGCCQKTDKVNNNTFTFEQTTEKHCNEIKPDYYATAWYGDKDAKGNKCENKTAPTPPRTVGQPVTFTPSVSIPGQGSPYTAGQAVVIPSSTQALANYIIAIFKYATGIIGIIAAIVLMFGGVRWLVAGGNSAAIGEAKTLIIGSLSGLILTMGSFLLLSTVNTSLVDLKVDTIKSIDTFGLDQGCCEKTGADDKKTYQNAPADLCNDKNMPGYKNLNFQAGKLAAGDKCIDKGGCCQVSVKIGGANTHAFDVTNEADCKAATIPESLTLSFTFKAGYMAAKDLISPSPVICAEKPVQ